MIGFFRLIQSVGRTTSPEWRCEYQIRLVVAATLKDWLGDTSFVNLALWQNYFVISGSASAALTGLVFVAVSVNARRISTSPGLRKIAAQTLLLLMTPLITSIILIVPGLSNAVAGSLCILGGCSLGLVLFLIGRSMDLSGEASSIRRLRHLTPSVLVCGCIIVGGVSLVFGFGGGLYWIAVAALLAFIGGVANAWFFVVRIDG